MRWLTDSVEKEAVLNQLTKQYAASVFVQSTYLNATSSSWEVLVRDDLSGGMPCPYVVKAGQKILVTPFFNRHMEWIGEGVSDDDVLAALIQRYSVGDIQLKGEYAFGEQRVHQQLELGACVLNNQAKRSLKKAAHFRITHAILLDKLDQLITTELSDRIAGIDGQTLPVLRQIVANYKGNGLHQINVFHNDSWCGGLWLIESEDTVLYLKGTTTSEAKKEGAMYLLMQEAINFTHSKGKTFDFGGSNVENVRRFNQHFGGKDSVYTQVTWNNAPWWWNLLRNLTKKWRKK